jgi:hypothetical protein
MKKRLLYAGLAVLLVSSLAVVLLRPSGALYRGRTVAYWRQAALMRDGDVVNPAPETAWEQAFHKVGVHAFDWDAEKAADRLFAGDPAGIPVLLQLLQDEDIKVCLRAAHGLSQVGHNKVAAEGLLERLKTADDYSLQLIAYEIGEIDPQIAAEAAVPILIQRMHDGSSSAMFMLGQYGPLAKAAVPEMLALLKQCTAADRDCVMIAVALLQIDPIATKAVALPVVLKEFRGPEPRDYAVSRFLKLESLALEAAKNIEASEPELAAKIRS